MRLVAVSVPMLDTGIGRDAGYADDAELMAAAREWEEGLDPTVRAMLKEVSEKMESALLGF